jgi:hypothetical protein
MKTTILRKVFRLRQRFGGQDRWQASGVFIVLLFMAGAASANDWRILDGKDGIEVALREEMNRNLPSMRGRAVLRGDIERLVAIILDPELATEWANGASKVTVVSRDALQAIVHTYIELVWPVWDRDLVTRAQLRILDPGREYILSMTATDGIVPEKEGVVRIKDATTQFHLKKEAPSKVWVEYLVNVDPAGNIPDWLARWTAESVPARTLENLQDQLNKR